MSTPAFSLHFRQMASPSYEPIVADQYELSYEEERLAHSTRELNTRAQTSDTRHVRFADQSTIVDDPIAAHLAQLVVDHQYQAIERSYAYLVYLESLKPEEELYIILSDYMYMERTMCFDPTKQQSSSNDDWRIDFGDSLTIYIRIMNPTVKHDQLLGTAVSIRYTGGQNGLSRRRFGAVYAIDNIEKLKLITDRSPILASHDRLKCFWKRMDGDIACNLCSKRPKVSSILPYCGSDCENGQLDPDCSVHNPPTPPPMVVVGEDNVAREVPFVYNAASAAEAVARIEQDKIPIDEVDSLPLKRVIYEMKLFRVGRPTANLEELRAHLNAKFGCRVATYEANIKWFHEFYDER